AAHAGRAKLLLAPDLGARIPHVGEHARGPAEHAILELDAVVDADVVLDLDPIAHPHVADIDVLPEHAVAPDARARRHVTEVPDARAVANLRAAVHRGGGMSKIAHLLQQHTRYYRHRPVRVPSLDLKAQYAHIRADVQAAVQRVLESQRFILGPEVEAFERELAAYCGAAHAVGVSSGTDALLVSLMALGIGPGDEVLTSPYSFFASAGVIARLHARPVFADIDPATFNLDPEAARRALTSRSRAVV